MTKRKPVVLATIKPTKAVADVIAGWVEFCKKNNLTFSPFTDIRFKANVVVEIHGHCPCARDTRFRCPCDQCLKEVEKFGTCFCAVFCSKKYVQTPTSFPHESFTESQTI